MAWTESDLAAIEAAVLAPELSVRFSDGREVVYRSITELLKARDVIKEAIRAAGGGPRCTLAKFVKD